MDYILTMTDGTLRLPRQLLDSIGLAADVQVTVRPENGGLLIRPVETEIERPIFRREEPPPLNLDDLLAETDEEHLTEGFSDSGLMTRAEFMTALSSYEEAHGMSSAEFHEKWQRGEMPDDIEFSMWAGLYECSLSDAPLLGEVPLEDIVGKHE